MPNRAYLKGARAEYIVRDVLRGRDYVVMRSFGSRGPFDLLAVRADTQPMLLAVKSHGARLRPVERERLVEEARRSRFRAVLAHYEAGMTTFRDLEDETWTGP